MSKKTSISGNTFGARLQAIRKQAGLSQGKLAEQLGYKTPGSVSNVEADRTPLDSDSLAKIAPLLNADLHWLLTGQPAPSAQEAAKERQEAINRLACYISAEVSKLLARKASLLAEQQELERKEHAGEPVDPEKGGELTVQLLMTERLLQDIANDQNWVRLALADTVDNDKQNTKK